MNIKLSHKLALLVSVPLIFELLFVTVLVNLYHAAQIQSDRISHSKEILGQLDHLAKIIYDRSLKSITSRSVLTESTSLSHDLKVVIRRLKILVSDNNEEMAAVHRLEIAVNRVLNGLIDFNKPQEMPILALNIGSKTQILREAFQTFAEQQFFITEQERKVQQEAPEKERQIHQWVDALLIFGVSVSALLTFLLVFLLHRATITRLNVIVDNSRRLAGKAPLRDPLTGADEIATVDSVFHEMAQELNAAAERDRQTQQMKQQLLEMVSHDLRAPLSSTSTFLEMLANGSFGAISDKLKTRSTAAAADMRRLVSMTSNLLELELRDAGKMQMDCTTVHISECLERSVASVETLAEQAQIEIVLQNSDQLIYADGDRLVQLFVNLLSNAIKFSPPGETILVNCNSSDTHISIEIVDHGSGIDPDLQMEIFERYSQAVQQNSMMGPGFGLGLAISQEIAEMHGGSIKVESQQGRGSTFTVLLPLHDEIDALPISIPGA